MLTNFRKWFIATLFILTSNILFAQIKFPAGFKWVKGENGSGADDVYSNGIYAFSSDNPFRDHDFKINDDSTRDFLSAYFNLPFKTTKDGYYLGTGLDDSLYKYIVVSPPGNTIILTSDNNDDGFAHYSTWLLSTVRVYKKSGKKAYFPMEIHP